MDTGKGPAEGTTTLSIRLLGGFTVTVGSQPVADAAWRLKRAATLVKLLALAPGHRVLRDSVVETLWPEDDPETSVNRLHHTLHIARRALGSDALRLAGGAISLYPPESVWVDVETFELALATARGGHDPHAYRYAVSLYAGDLLPDELYEDWAAGRREALRSAYLSALSEMASLFDAAGDIGAAIAALQRAVQHEPALEEAHVGLIRLYGRTGQRYAAIRQYEQLRAALRSELDAEPDEATQALYTEIVAGVVPDGPATSIMQGPVDTGPHNLPIALTSFVGREAEMVETRRLLDTTRLLTVIGPGGAGKTRIALQVAWSLLGHYRDGVWLVELASLAEGQLVPAAIADAVGVAELPDELLTTTLVNALQQKHLLLVLDNCEHLVADCAALVETLLERCPELRILATSREILDVPGEVTGLVPPLSLVPNGAAKVQIDPDELLQSDAVRLFVERARSRNPSFALTTANGPAIVDICTRVDGIPLAIELAAARVGALSVQQIALRLEDCMNLLTTGGRTREPRQQTLRGALDWSYRLLSPEEMDLFRRLSVFSGGWTLESGETLASAGNSLDLLSRLVDKSLVTTEAQPDGTVRYRLLEPTRQYAHARLVESGEASQIQAAHAALFLTFATHAAGQLRSPEQGTWLTRLSIEHDNLRAALEWYAGENGDPAAGLRLASHMWMFWYSRSHLREGREWLDAMLQASPSTATEERALCLRGLGVLLYGQREYAQAARYIEEALVIYRQLNDQSGIATVTGNLATILCDQGEMVRAWQLHEEALALRRALGDELGIATTLSNMGAQAFRERDYERASLYFQESSDLNRALGDLGSLTLTLNNLGSTRIAQEQWKLAAPVIIEALRISAELEDREVMISCMGGLSEVAFHAGQLHRAVQLDGASDAMREALGPALHADDQERQDQHRANLRAKVGSDFDHLYAQGHAMREPDAIAYALAADFPAQEQTPPRPSRSDDVVKVSRREREIITLIAGGLTNRQIADQLSIAERTADTHVSNILRKLGLSSRAQVAVWAVQNGLTPAEQR